MKPSPLQLNQTLIGAVSIEPKTGEFSDQVNVTTTPLYGRSDDNPNQWQVKLLVIFKGSGDKPAQYEGNIEVSGVFTVVDEMPEEKQLRFIAVTCPSLLYSTARETIAFLTGRGPHGTFLLPSVSFIDLTINPDSAITPEPTQKRVKPARPPEVAV